VSPDAAPGPGGDRAAGTTPSPGALAAEIAAALTARGESLAVAEAASGGLVSAALVAVPGASAWFAGGAVAYGAAAKARWLGLAPESFVPQGVVSPAGAQAMAEAVRLRLGTTWGLAEVGIAGPQTGRRSRKGAGLSYVAVSGPRPAQEEVRTGRDDRPENQAAFALAALLLLRDAMRAAAPRP
jgi:nicotinamide-nucleotide amidase